MSGKGLAKRIALTLATTAGFFVLLTVDSSAMPIRPDVKKLLAEPQATMQFAPARAGWQGSEMNASVPSSQALLNGSAAAQEMRASLLAIAVPDWRLLLFITLAIIGLRRLRRPALQAPVHSMPARQESPPAKAA